MKNDIEIDQNFVCLWSGLLETLGGQHGPKASQNGARGALDFPPVFGLGMVLEGSWELLEAFGAQEVIFMDF